MRPTGEKRPDARGACDRLLAALVTKFFRCNRGDTMKAFLA